MEYYDINNKLYYNLINEYSTGDMSIGWKMFIASKNLGIESICVSNGIYKIVDKKKWMLTCIRYGIL
jgi:hypothetical protein